METPRFFFLTKHFLFRWVFVNTMSVTVSGRIIKLYLIVPNRAPHYIVILYRQRSTYTAVVPPPVFVNRTPYHRYTHARKEINADIRNTFQDILLNYKFETL